MNANTLPIILCTCDGYSDLWPDFFRLLKKYWPEYNGTIVLDSETKSFKCPGLNVTPPLDCDKNLSWSERLYLSLCRIDSPYCLIFLDDFFLRGKVDISNLSEVVDYMERNEDVAGVTFLKEPGGCKAIEVGAAKFTLRKKFSPYTVTAHITLYRTDFLKGIVRKGESAWEFETNGTIRSWFTRYRFVCAMNNDAPIFPYDWGALVRGGCFDEDLKAYFNDKEECNLGETRPTREKDESLQEGPSLFKVFKYGARGFKSLFSERCSHE